MEQKPGHCGVKNGVKGREYALAHYLIALNTQR